MSAEPQPLRIDLTGVTLNVSDRGCGRAILLLHGFPDSLRMWDGVVPHLVAAGYRVVAYDQRGFGESSAPIGRRSYALDAIVQDALDVIAARELGGPLTVVGHDWGAAVSWCLALQHPEVVARQVTISVGHPVAFRHGGLRQKLRSWYMAFFQMPGVSEWALSRKDFACMRRLAAGHPDPERFTRDMARPGRFTAALNWYRRGAIELLTRRWGTCQVPTLGLFSTGDPVLVEKQMTNSKRYMAAEWAYERFEGVGHWIPMEEPERVAGLIADWAARA